MGQSCQSCNGGPLRIPEPTGPLKPSVPQRPRSRGAAPVDRISGRRNDFCHGINASSDAMLQDLQADLQAVSGMPLCDSWVVCSKCQTSASARFENEPWVAFHCNAFQAGPKLEELEELQLLKPLTSFNAANFKVSSSASAPRAGMEAWAGRDEFKDLAHVALLKSYIGPRKVSFLMLHGLLARSLL